MDNMYMKNRCNYCDNLEHEDTQGFKSVSPQFEGLWWCSLNCMCSYKDSGGKEDPMNKVKRAKKMRHNRMKNK